MILVDGNLLIYAANRNATEHVRASAWLNQKLSGPARVGLPWLSLLAFVRLASNPTVIQQPLTPAGAWRQVLEWLGSGVTWIPIPGDRHIEILGQLLDNPLMSSR